MGRIVLGKRATVNSEDLRGVFISGLNTSSGSGTDASPYASANVVATNASGQLEATTFDSGAHIGGGLQVYDYFQGSLIQTSINDEEMYTDITHNWGLDQYGSSHSGKTPAFAFRWTPSQEISGGVATKTYHPINYYFHETYEEYEEEEENSSETEYFVRVEAQHINANTIRVYFENYDTEGQYSNQGIYYALIIFYEDDYNGGKSI